MFFIHTFTPSSTLFTIGPITIFWYGVIIVLAIIIALVITMLLAKKKSLSSDIVFDMAIWLLIGGIIGARLYETILELPYYIQSPQEIVKIWHGGLAIHGALLGGLIALFIFSRIKKFNFWHILSLTLPGVAIAQAIGRWGNWFNQELFGLPTNSLLGIPIEYNNRPMGYENFMYFHPTFLYESFGCLLIGLFLYYKVSRRSDEKIIVGYYALLYGIVRFFLEFIKIDPTPILFGLRWPQIISLLLIMIGILLILSPILPKAVKRLLT